MNLWELSPGRQAKVVEYDPLLNANYITRLKELGFHVGRLVSCELSPSMGAPKLYRVDSSIYSLDDNIAKYITVTY